MKRTLIAAFVLALSSTAASETRAYFPPEFAKPSYTCAWGKTNSGPLEIVSGFESSWYSGQLRAAEVPSLYIASKNRFAAGRETIRFTWLRSFHPPVVVRVEVDERGGHLIAKQLSGAGGYDPGEIEHRIERRLKNSELATLRSLVARTELLEMDPADCSIGVDGAEWIIEDVDQRGYHFVKRWSPSHGPVREVGDFLVGLTGWHYKDVY